MTSQTSGAPLDTRAALLEAAIAVLDERGDAAIRVRDICEQVGVAATSLYHFFGSREGLVDEANAERYRRSFDWQQTELPERVAACTSRDDLRQVLRGIIAMFATPISEQRRAIRRAVLGSAVTRPALAARLTQIDLEYARFMARLFTPAQREGWVRRDVDLEALVMWQTAQGIARAIVDRSAGAVDLAAFDRISAEALIAVVMGEAPVDTTTIG